MLYTTPEINQVIADSGLDKVIPVEVMKEVRRRYREDHRSYHDWDHAIAVLSWVNHVCRVFPERALAPYTHQDLRTAALFHDAVYHLAKQELSNEEQSISFMIDVLKDNEHYPSLAQINALISATEKHGKHKPEELDMATALFLDCDIANLGEPRYEIFSYHNELVAEEFRRVYTAEQVAEGRKAFLVGMLAQPVIFLSPYMRDRLESNARYNLSRKIQEG
jgi:predicted metal-dependent HD superfamily phosphohydrolase